MSSGLSSKSNWSLNSSVDLKRLFSSMCAYAASMN